MQENAILAAEEFLRAPLAMEVGAVRSLTSAVARMKAGGTVAAGGSGRGQGKGRSERTVGVLPVFGPITPRASVLYELFGVGTPLDVLGEAFDAAVNSPAFGEIVLWIDSPGGSVFGVPEFAQKVFDARRKKKVTAMIDGYGASAAYWIASQASEVVITPSGEAGSIGVLVAHWDMSKAAEKEGVKVTYIFAGEKKVLGNSFEPLGDAARAEFQRGVDHFYGMLVRAVARGRGVTPSEVRNGFGAGGMLLAGEAVREKLADRIAPFDAVLSAAVGRAGSPTAGVTTPAPTAKLDSALELRKRRLALTLSDDRARLAETAARVKAQTSPPPPKPTRPAGRTAEDDAKFARHEAGHVVAALALRVPVKEATIDPGTCPAQGAWEGCVTEASRPRSVEKLVIVLAGAEAEGSYLRGPDEAIAAECATPGGALWQQARDRARRILSVNFAAVRGVANALMEHRTLTGEQLKAAAGHVHPG